MHCTDSKYINMQITYGYIRDEHRLYTIHDVDELGYDTTPLNVIKLDIFSRCCTSQVAKWWFEAGVLSFLGNPSEKVFYSEYA